MSVEKCPICGNSLSTERYFESGIGYVEEYEDCICCNYSYEFAYGAYRESFGQYIFCWSYSCPCDSPLFKRMKKKKFMAKRNWRKGLKDKYKGVVDNGGIY